MGAVARTAVFDAVQDERRELDEIIRGRAVEAVYQPIVELDSGDVVAWEALARGPRGTQLVRPVELFAAAAEAGRTADLDHCCRLAAINGALDANLGRRQELFINIEPYVAGAMVPPDLARALQRAQSDLRVTVEITERDLTVAPAELMTIVDTYRRWGWGIALDDVGADPRSIALMPLLRPDVIKLDMAFLHEPMTRERARVVHAVAAEAERSGATVLAEGIESTEQLAIARALGATLGQGWHFGRPGELRAGPEVKGTGRTSVGSFDERDTPFEYVSERRKLRIGTKSQLLQMSLALEESAATQGSSAVLLATFQEAGYFPRSTRERYAALAGQAAFVGALARGLDDEPARGVRGSALEDTDSLRGEWDVVVLGPHFAGAFVARDRGDCGPDAARSFEYAITYDRDIVVGAATRLIRRIARRG